MQDWKIAVLVVIIVVFLVLAALLLFLLYRFGNWRRFTLHRKKKTLRYIDDVEENIIRNRLQEGATDSSDMYQQLFLYDPRLHPSPHVMYLIDFQGELLSLDFKKKSLHNVKTEPDLQRYLFDAFHPTIEEGNRVTAVTPEMLALSYVDDRQALVVLDLNRLLDRDAEFGARMQHTAERPLLFSRLVPNGVDGSVYTTLTRFGYSVGAPPSMRVRPDGNYLVAPPQAQQSQQIAVDVAESRANPIARMNPMARASASSAAAAAAVPPSAFPGAAQYPPPTHTTSLYVPDVPGMAPAPIIHPCGSHHITTNTPITVTAATYTVLHSNGTRSVLDAANTALIESARLQWDRRQSLVVTLVSGSFTGYQCVVDPVTENGNLFPPRGGGGFAEPIVCQRADALQYTVERVNSTQWLPVERALYLPGGRWCVRARAVLYSDDSSKSSAKVFTVNVM
ncbi:hypothetical protein ABB37_05201 [Leptomonas pyrrhocoris]|uniref:Uncharacterized protein n=1 Tax=Leptomonas pyrrhocoris TaxID=157538 RepID=A0A0M9G127_LEPPY|nr:hypothetical protein ABB37_05201 [Leptomonas pyrrhocoris]KPA80230.1 hypothetical protein ABB37_05201 [Leptomonas pyrrhocoris]|eukprot:XP_015658669.1 hypothetical protein ABB37_05201 [Leptomonas pyrrhocoris]